MALAELSGQSFLELLDWHPRDVDSLWQIYSDRAEAAQQQVREASLAAARQAVFDQMRAGR